MFEMTEEEFEVTEASEARKHDEKVKELRYEKKMEVDIDVSMEEEK